MTVIVETTDAPADESTPYVLTAGDVFEGAITSESDRIDTFRLLTDPGREYLIVIESPEDHRHYPR